jgi:hypothetical protein
MLPGELAKTIARNAAAPTVPPIDRKNVTAEVATPISRGDTAFWTASTMGCMLPDRPSPKRAITIIVSHSGVSAPTCVKSSSATTIRAVPATGKTRYRPVLAMTWPKVIAPIMMPPTSGIT